MPRPRADGGQARGAVRIGKERTDESGKKWRARAYAPTSGAPNGRVVYVNLTTGKLTSSVPTADETLDQRFDRIERWLDQNVALSRGTSAGTSSAPGSGRRDMAALGDLYLEYLTDQDRSPDYIANRRCLINKWVTPVVGELLVSQWGVSNSLKIIKNARPHLSAARLDDLGSTLSGMRATAHLKREGGRWLSPDDNPLERVSYGKGTSRQGASSKWVPPHRRPATGMVHKAIRVAGQVSRWDWMAVAISVAAFCAPRQGELLGLRAVDVDLSSRGWTSTVPGSHPPAASVPVAAIPAPDTAGPTRRTASGGPPHSWDLSVRCCAGVPLQQSGHPTAPRSRRWWRSSTQNATGGPP